MTQQEHQGGLMRRMGRASVAAAALALFSVLPAKAGAETWPDKPIRIVVPYAAGGSNDVIARRLAQELTQSLGQAVMVENRGGAAGAIGADVVARATPDGYTYLLVSSSLATTAATSNPPYDTLKAFAAVARVADAPFLMVVRKDFPAKTLPEFVKYAKAHPGAIDYATTGSGDIAHLLTERFSTLAGIKMQQIGYKGIGPAQLDLIAGRTDFLITTLASIGGTPAADLPKLAFTGHDRDPGYSNVPTVREATGLDYEATVWWGVFAPSGTPDPILDRMNKEITRIVARPEFKTFLGSVGASPSPSGRPEFAAQLKHDVEVYTKTAQSIGLVAHK